MARSVSALVVGIISVVAVVACGSDSADLRGIVRDAPLTVGDLVLPQIVGDPAEPDGLSTRPFAVRAAGGELLVVYFGFTNCPDLCPTTLAEVRAAVRRLDPGDRERVSVAMVTVDPERDTPEILARYLASFTDRPVPLRTEDPQVLAAAEGAFLANSEIVVDEAGKVEVAHTTATYVVDSSGTVIVEWPFGLDAESMAHDLGVLLGPAGKT
jgi:protein SCO1